MEDLGIDRKFLNASQTRPLTSVAGSYTYFADGDLLLPKITPCFENGKLGIAAGLCNGIGFGSSEFVVLRPSANLDKEFLYYFLARPSFRAEGEAQMGGAVGQQRLPKGFVEGYKIPVPPLQEQRRIVHILDKAFEAVAAAKANTEKNLQNARALFEGHLQAAFTKPEAGWAIKELGAVSAISYGFTERASSEPVGPKFLRITDIQDDQVDWDRVPYCTIEPADLPKYRLASGDLVFARTGATTGKSFLIAEPPAAVHASYLIRLRLHEKALMPEFVSLFFQTEGYWRSIKDGSAGSTQGGFNATKLAALPIPIPPLREQQRIVASLEEARERTRRLRSIHARKLDELEALKSSLLQSAFSGQL